MNKLIYKTPVKEFDIVEEFEYGITRKIFDEFVIKHIRGSFKVTPSFSSKDYHNYGVFVIENYPKRFNPLN